MTSFKGKMRWSLKDLFMGPVMFRVLSFSFHSQHAKLDLSTSLKTSMTSVILEEYAGTEDSNAIKNF